MSAPHRPTNAQEIFNTVALHLITQGRPALAADGVMCAYRAPDGARCAVGILIPDDCYQKEMEGRTVHDIALPSHLKRQHDFLLCLQWVHDECATDPADNFLRSDLKRRLNEVAEQFALNNQVLAIA